MSWVVSADIRDTAATSHTIGTLTNGVTYRVRLRTFDPDSPWVFASGTPQVPADTTAPSVSAFVPGDGTTTADAGTNITLTFTEAVRKDAANADFTGHADLSAILTLARTNASGTAIPYTASIDAGKTVITIDPTDDLADGAVYVGISGAYYDAGGNAGSAASATFTVAAPAVRSSDANLSALAASTSTSSGGAFSALSIGTFSAATTGYTASVPYATTHVKLTPTVAATGIARVAVRKGSSGGFTTVTSGSASRAIALGVGANPLTVRVTAEDGTVKDYTVTVTRGAQAPATVTLSAAPALVEEGRPVTVEATLSRALSRAVTIPVTVTRGSAEAEDLGTLSGIRIARGRTSGTARIATRQDDDMDDETFTVALTTASLPSGVVAGAVTSVALTIDDDDTPTVNLSFSPRDGIEAGDSVTLTATLSAALTGAVTIPLVAVPEEGTTSADYGAVPAHPDRGRRNQRERHARNDGGQRLRVRELQGDARHGEPARAGGRGPALVGAGDDQAPRRPGRVAVGAGDGGRGRVRDRHGASQQGRVERGADPGDRDIRQRTGGAARDPRSRGCDQRHARHRDPPGRRQPRRHAHRGDRPQEAGPGRAVHPARRSPER